MMKLFSRKDDKAMQRIIARCPAVVI